MSAESVKSAAAVFNVGSIIRTKILQCPAQPYISAESVALTPPAQNAPVAIAWTTAVICVAQSPAAKTPGTLVVNIGSVTLICPVEVSSSPN